MSKTYDITFCNPNLELYPRLVLYADSSLDLYSFRRIMINEFGIKKHKIKSVKSGENPSLTISLQNVPGRISSGIVESWLEFENLIKEKKL